MLQTRGGMECLRPFVNGINPFNVLAIDGGVSLIRYTNTANTNHTNDRAKFFVANVPTPEMCGFANLGNTCFMNSVLQCLRHTRPLLEYCLNFNNEGDRNLKGSIFLTYAKLMKLTSKSSGDVFLIEFRSHVATCFNRFSGDSQQDAQEFLLSLLEKMHADLRTDSSQRSIQEVKFDDHLRNSRKKLDLWDYYKRKEASQIMDIFVGILRSTLRCTRCKAESHSFEQFFDLSLPTSEGDQDTTLTECISHFTRQEVLDGDNKPICDKCKSKQKFVKCYSIEKFPRILILHFKRFNNGARRKTMVNFPLTKLDLTKFAVKSGETVSYNLYAVSSHSGSLDGGHYTAFARDQTSGGWHLYNDSRVTRVEERNVVTRDAYLLFYELSR